MNYSVTDIESIFDDKIDWIDKRVEKMMQLLNSSHQEGNLTDSEFRDAIIHAREWADKCRSTLLYLKKA